MKKRIHSCIRRCKRLSQAVAAQLILNLFQHFVHTYIFSLCFPQLSSLGMWNLAPPFFSLAFVILSVMDSCYIQNVGDRL